MTDSKPSGVRDAAKAALQELANTQMQISIADWSRISSAILSALEPAQPDPVGYALAIEQAAEKITSVLHNTPSYLTVKDIRGLMGDCIRALTPPADRLAVVLAMPEVRALVEAAYSEGFVEGAQEGWVDNPRAKRSWKEIKALAALVQP